jgi:hypothetical protein
MDKETKHEFERLYTKVDETNRILIDHVGRDKGLELPTRVTKLERRIMKAPTWGGLVASITVVCLVIGAFVGFVKIFV